MSNRIPFAALAAVLAVAACGQDDVTSPSDVAADPARVVSTVTLANGGTVTYLDLGDGDVGVAEYTPATAAGANALPDPGHGSHSCEPTGVEWYNDWKAAFVGITKYREAAYRHFKPGPYFFYPGAAAYHGTNTNSKTYLGACNGDHEVELRLEIHRWVDEKWKRILLVGLESGAKYTFYSGVPARYRGKAYGRDGETVEHYGVGAAWTLSPGVTTP
jgi:hypothetical protein